MSNVTDITGLDEMNNPKRKKPTQADKQLKEYAKRAKEAYTAFFLQRTGKEYKPNQRFQAADTWTKIAKCAMSIDITPEDYVAAQFNYARSLILPTMITGQKGIAKAKQYKNTVMFRAEEAPVTEEAPVERPVTDVAYNELKQRRDKELSAIAGIKGRMKAHESLIDIILECPWRSDPLGILLAIPGNDRLVQTYAVAANRMLTENPHLAAAMKEHYIDVLNAINWYVRNTARH